MGNCTLGSYCLEVTPAKYCIVFCMPKCPECPIANDQLPKQPLLNEVYINNVSFLLHSVLKADMEG